MATGTLRLLEAARIVGLEEKTRIYNAASSELFGLIQEPRQKESTPFYPRSPYAVTKLAAFWISKNYREAYDMFVANGILFNHSSDRRGLIFVCRKITHAVAHIKKGRQECLHLGNLNAKRDFTSAKNVVVAMWMMLQAEKPGDYVAASGVAYSVRQLVETAFQVVGEEIK